MVAMAAGVAPIVPGFLHKAFVTAYNSAWLVSIFIAGARRLQIIQMKPFFQ